MGMSPIELFKNDHHTCLMYTDLVDEDGQAVQANQFLVVDHGVGALIDPGGNLAFNELFLGLSRHFTPQSLSYIVASHADPDIIASLDRWLTTTRAQLVISRVWERFVPHFTKVGKTDGRVIGVADAGGRLPLGRSELWLLPAHFLHSEGNFQFYDPVSRILFTGDLGVSMTSSEQARRPVTELKPHLPRHLHPQPQHGAPIEGQRAIADFFDWAESLACGIDLFDQRAYQLPTTRIVPVSA
jgi:flavorubredoxin